jgi:hypothetical protein
LEIIMPAVYANATIANATSAAIPAAAKGVQPPIGHNALTAANNEMWNGHIGLRASSTIAAGSVPPADYYGVTTTPGLDKAGAAKVWTITAGAGAWA